MRIAFSTKGNSWDSSMDPRFGRAEMFLIYDEEKDALEEIDNKETDGMDHGVGPQTVKKMLSLSVDVIVTGNGAGEKALAILKKSNVKMYTGAGDMTLKEAYTAYKNDKLQLQF